MNTISRASIFGAAAILAAIGAVVYAIARSPYITEAGVVREQPVPFSHQHHVGEAGIDCRYCHTSVETSPSAGMPSTKTCLNCHSQLWRDSPVLAPVHESFDGNQPLACTRVHDLPDFAYFDHSIHLHKGIGSSTCHGRVDEMPLMWREATLQMQWCLDCHRNPQPHIRPREKLFDPSWTPDGESEFDAAQLMIDYHVKSKTDCSVCHR